MILEVMGIHPWPYLIYSTEHTLLFITKDTGGPDFLPWVIRFLTQFSSDFLGTEKCLAASATFIELDETASSYWIHPTASFSLGAFPSLVGGAGTG